MMPKQYTYYDYARLRYRYQQFYDSHSPNWTAHDKRAEIDFWQARLMEWKRNAAQWKANGTGNTRVGDTVQQRDGATHV